MNAQQAYEQMVAHFSQPNAKLATRLNDNGIKVCEYRLGRQADSPVRCAVGCLIPDELYDPRLDEDMGCGISELFETAGLGDPLAWQVTTYLWGGESTDSDLEIFLADAQNAHDNASDADNFLHYLAVIADDYGLTPVR